MNLLSVFHFLIIAIDLMVGLFVFYTNPQRRANQSFFILSLLLLVWQSCMASAFLAPSLDVAAIFIRGCMMIGAMIPVCFDLLRAAIVRPTESWRRLLSRSLLWFTISVAMGLVSLTHFFILGASYATTATETARSIPDPIYSIAFPIYGVFFVFGLMTLLYRFVRDLRNSVGIQKTELQFIFLGSGSSVFIGIVTALVIPLFTNNSQSVQLTPLSVLCLYIVIAYGIATRRIMDVAYFMRRLTAYALLFAWLALLYAGTCLLLNFVLQKLWIPLPALSYFIASLVVAFSMVPASGLMQQVAARLFVNFATLNISDLMRAANALMLSISTVETLLHEFANLLIKTIGTDRVCILIGDDARYVQRYPKAEDNEGLTLSRNSPIPQALLEWDEPLVPVIIHRLKPTALVAEACRLLDQNQFAAAISLRSQEGLEGIVLLGPRLSGSIYGAPEQHALQLLCNHLAVALNNARLYTQLQDSKIYNETLVDSLVSGVVAASLDGTITVFNREAQRITGLAATDTLTQPLGVLPRPLENLLKETLKGSPAIANQDFTLPQSHGEPIPLRVSSSVIYGHAGKKLGAFLVVNDLTTIRQLELQVRRTDRLASLGTLAAGMAHEIKNPLVSIKTFTQLMPERYDDADFRETFSSLVGGEVKRIDSIVNQLLRFSRPSKPVLAAISLHDLLNNALKLLQQQMRSKNIQLSTSFTIAPDSINADGDQLSQAFINFFLNAIEAMQQGGTLTVVTSQPSPEHPSSAWWNGHPDRPMILVRIQDTGEGISQEDLTHIFDPFFTTKSQGTGLGLSVAHGIIQEHSGLIDVKSEAGHGTTFTIAIPLLKEDKPV
jgi:PAS domain S-box-containing protein